MENLALKEEMRLRDPDQIFDLVCFANYFAGQYNQNIPVDDSREALERIKKLLSKKSPTKS